MKFSFSIAQRDKKQRMQTALALTALLIFLSVIAGALFGDSGILVSLQVKADYEKLRVERDAIQSENQRIKQDVFSLKNNPRAIEAIGRAEFGFGRPGEIVYLFREPTDKDQAGTPQTH